METLSPVVVSAVFAAVVLAGAYCGALARHWVPPHHRDDHTLDVVKLGVGFLGTLAALVLGLVVSSAKGSFDTKTVEVQDVAAKVLQLDRSLKRMGDEAQAAREALRALVAARIGSLGDRPASGGEHTISMAAAQGLVSIEHMLHGLQPKDDVQRRAIETAQSLVADVQRIMSNMVSQAGSSITAPLLVLLVFWFAVIMAGWNFLSPMNGTTLFVNVLCALSLSGAIFMLLEMDQPFGGMIQVSDGPLRVVLPHLAR
jgi:outer membrane murein-binding lipoprotein Lpp